ncbi:cbb3-type cytochrome c oxidase subunit II [Horticoccus sp. 23ND18S-11]|uniref:cbb3-type cytochrome c oxidase subunit II n=1 Tax=Horticoccus sp. 23ND18S-11 TaxID=3391832 RepID=UPI0039C9B945
MKNGPLFLLGLFVALVISFGGVVLGSHAQLGRLTPYYDDTEGSAFPLRSAGIASRGQLVYADLGCASCHTQQVRRPDYGSDQARGWGDRQSVARDYIHQARPQLGASRFGPDLANYGARKPTEEGILRILYLGAATHPSYKFLFNEKKIDGEQSAKALALVAPYAPAPGYQIVPTERALTLAAYLLNSNNAYEYPEARPMAPEKKAAAPDAKAKAGETKK